VLIPDFANRSSVVRLRKQEPGYEFHKYEEGGDLLKHVGHNQPLFLGAVFAVVKAWYEAGKPASRGVRHDFRHWAGALDWIVVNLLGEAPLMEGHEDIKRRTTNPSLTWLRKVANAVKTIGRLGEPLRPNDILTIISQRDDIDVPGFPDGADLEDEPTRMKVFRAIGKRLSDCMAGDGRAEVDEFVVTRSVTSDDHWRETKEYRFELRQPGSDPEVNPEEKRPNP
jgi:hypothetical protein